MTKPQGLLVTTLSIALALIMLGMAGWAAGAQERGPVVTSLKDVDKLSTETTSIATVVKDGISITVSGTWAPARLWLNVQAANGSIEVTDKTGSVNGVALASIRAYEVDAGGQENPFNELATLGEGIVVTVKSDKDAIDGLIFYAPQQPADSSCAIIAGKKDVSRNNFKIKVLEFGPALISVRVFEWPPGDPIIFRF